MGRVTETGNVRWEPTTWGDIRPGDRIAPLASWTLDIYEVDPEGNAVALNHDTNVFTSIKFEADHEVHRLVLL